MGKAVLTIIFLFLALTACQSGEERAGSARPGSDSSRAAPAYDPYEGCPRGVPVPLLSQKEFPASIFRLDSASRTGYESAALNGGDSLVVVQSGCEYAITSFRFYTKAPSGMAAGQLRLTRKAISVLDRIIRGLEEPRFFMEGTRVLTGQLAAGSLQVGKEYPFGSGQPGSMIETIALKEVRALPLGRLLVRVDFSMGPL